MRNKEELLKIYSAYLPYELKFIYSRDIPSEVNAWKLVALLERKNSDSDFFAKATRKDYQNQINTTLNLIKPILYSMDMLTKEIEHKGERLIPIIEVLKRQSKLDLSECIFEISPDEDDGTSYIYVDAEKKGRYVDSISYDGNIFYNHHYSTDKPINPQNEVQNLLLEWHFNVFGLDESEYIKKESLK